MKNEEILSGTLKRSAHKCQITLERLILRAKLGMNRVLEVVCLSDMTAYLRPCSVTSSIWPGDVCAMAVHRAA